MPAKILQWVKSNLLIVISCFLILVLLPTGYIFSSGWNKSIQDKASKAYNEEKRKLQKASEVEYALPAVLEGEESISEKRAPNTLVTNFYKARIAQREAQVQEVISRGVEFNKADHTVPVENLLPKAPDATALRQRGYKLGQLIAGTPEAPSLYARLLRNLNAGDAPDPTTLNASLSQFKQQQQEEYAATSASGQVSEEQTKLLQQSLIKRRLDEYASRAESIAFYCPLSAIQTTQPEPGYSFVPNQAPGYDAINEAAVYTWVWDYWIISDVLKGVTAANTDPSGVTLAVPDAPVKHVEQIRIAEFKSATAAASEDDFGGGSPSGRGGRGGRGGSDPDPSTDPSAATKTYTNRTGGTPDALYDTRMVEMTVIASSKDLPLFFDALGKTNYMTVVDVDLSQVDVWDALNQGYFYGPDHLVRAHITIETIWLRSWTAPLMPDAVRTTLGLPTASGNPEDADG